MAIERINAAAVLRWRITGAALPGLRQFVDLVGEERWLQRPFEDDNALGFTLWHGAAVTDFTVHTIIRGVPEVRARPPFAGTGVDTRAVPLGMPFDEATQIANATDAATVGAYYDQVIAEVDAWLADLTDDDLASRPDTEANLAATGIRETPGFREEFQHVLHGQVYELLGRPCMGHLFVHQGELEVGVRLVRGRRAG